MTADVAIDVCGKLTWRLFVHEEMGDLRRVVFLACEAISKYYSWYRKRERKGECVIERAFWLPRI